MSRHLLQPIKSMTAFGRKSLQNELGTLVFEIQSLNRRFLEINLFLPSLFNSFEVKIRSWMRERLGRGVVTLTLSFAEKERGVPVTPNLFLAKEIKNGWEKIASELGLDFKANFNFSMLADVKGIMSSADPNIDEKLTEEILKEGVIASIDSLLEMRESEGRVLKEDIEKRIDNLQKGIRQVESYASQTLIAHREKLKTRLSILLGESEELDERILREICLIAERSDYTEEVVRFNSHLEQLRHFLEDPLVEESETRGKKIEFLLQELARELNTIGSKASDAKVAHLVVEAKGEVEKIREQSQNIE